MIVAPIGDEIARPFVEAACVRYGVGFDGESGRATMWWAGLQRSGLRAVLGWAAGEPGSLLIVGPFGDGSGMEDAWMHDLLRSMQGANTRFVVIPASPSLYIRRQSVQLERYGMVRTPQYMRA